MLIERDICVPAHEKYGVDIFGDAIRKYGVDIFGDAIRMARENAAAAGEQIYFINRDYFDFTHRHKFDEIITNMPVRSAARAGAKSKEEMDAFYQKLIYFINRDYFDFTHRHKFDEIITNMPVRSAARAGAKSKEEMDAFYQKFFDRSAGLLESGGMMILYGNEQGFVKKQLRLRDDYRLLREHVIRQKDRFHLFLIQYCP